MSATNRMMIVNLAVNKNHCSDSPTKHRSKKGYSSVWHEMELLLEDYEYQKDIT